jgi:hypothetical protein
VTLAELIADFREESGDNGTDPFWTDDRLSRLATEGQIEACRRGYLLIDSTSSICTVGVVANDPVVALDKRITGIMRARWSSGGFRLLPITCQEMDAYSTTWENDTGTPTNYVTNYQSGAIRLYPSPTVSADLLLTVSRMPLNNLVDDEDEPELRDECQPALVQWMLHRAYAKQDADTFDKDKSQRALAEFEREFGRKVSARNEEWRRSALVVGAEPIA